MERPAPEVGMSNYYLAKCWPNKMKKKKEKLDRERDKSLVHTLGLSIFFYKMLNPFLWHDKVRLSIKSYTNP